MHPDTLISSATSLTLSRRHTLLAELALAVGGFAIGTGEFATMGLLPEIAGDLQVSEPVAGHVISAYALGVVIGSPVIAVLAARAPRKLLLIGLMALFALGNIASAFAWTDTSLALLRFITAIPHGAYFGVAALTVAGMAPPEKRAQAVGRVMLGLTVATLVGTPLATWLGQGMGWRAAFIGVAMIGLATVLLVSLFVPTTRGGLSSPLAELGALRRPQVWLTLGIAAIGNGGMFAVFTYVAATLTKDAGLPVALVPVALCVFGAGMVAGNIVGSWLADRALMATIAGVLVWDCCVATLYVVAAHQAVTALAAVFLVGTGFAIVPGIQTRLMDVADDAQTLAASLNHSAFNIANAIGAWAGGAVIAAGFGFAATGFVGTVLSLAGLGVVAVSLALARSGPHASPRHVAR